MGVIPGSVIDCLAGRIEEGLFLLQLIDQLSQAHGSIPRNPLLAKALTRTETFNGKGTGTYIEPALALGLVELTIPQSPSSPRQQYRLTARGQAL